MSSVGQRVVYIGRETIGSEGVAVTVDTALRAKASFKAVVEKIQPDEDIGSYAPQRHYIGSLKGSGSLDIDGYYEHAPWPIAMAMGVGSVGAPTGAYYPWTWNIPDASYYAFATATLEYFDGANHVVRSADVFATEIEISGEAGKSWMFKCTLTGASTDFPAAPSATPAAPSPVNTIRMADTHMYMDNDYSNIGVTEMTSLISFTWKFSDFQHAKLFSGSLYPTSRGINKWKATLEFIAEIDDAKIESEKDKLLTTSTTAIRVQGSSGSNIARIDGQYFLDNVDSLDNRDGNNIVKMSYKMQKSAGSLGQIYMVSTLASL